MKKLALVVAAVAGLGFAVPSAALAQGADVSVRVGDGPRTGVVVRGDRGHHYGWRNRHHHRGYYHHRAQADRVVIVKKRKPAKKTVIIER